MTDKPDGKRLNWTLMVVVVSLVLYVLSIGPAARFATKQPSRAPEILAFWKPVRQVGRVEVLGTALAAYTTLWLSDYNKALQDPDKGLVIVYLAGLHQIHF